MLLVVISLAACNNTAASLPTPTLAGVGKKVSVAGAGSYTDVSPAELQKMLAGKDFTLVDVWITEGAQASFSTTIVASVTSAAMAPTAARVGSSKCSKKVVTAK
jgi:hypothetical protein